MCRTAHVRTRAHSSGRRQVYIPRPGPTPVYFPYPRPHAAGAALDKLCAGHQSRQVHLTGGGPAGSPDRRWRRRPRPRPRAARRPGAARSSARAASKPSGMPAKSTAGTRSQMIMSGRDGSRSTQAPAGNPVSSHGSHAVAARAPTTNGLACRPMTASSGTPASAITLPSWLTVSPNHSSRKFRCQTRPPCRRSPVSGSPAFCLPARSAGPGARK
jgi:hypothetical protein